MTNAMEKREGDEGVGCMGKKGVVVLIEEEQKRSYWEGAIWKWSMWVSVEKVF